MFALHRCRKVFGGSLFNLLIWMRNLDSCDNRNLIRDGHSHLFWSALRILFSIAFFRGQVNYHRLDGTVKGNIADFLRHIVCAGHVDVFTVQNNFMRLKAVCFRPIRICYRFRIIGLSACYQFQTVVGWLLRISVNIRRLVFLPL